MIDPIKRRNTKKALEKIKKRTEEIMAEGKSERAARDQAFKEARDNPRRDYRRKAVKTKYNARPR
jgi:hypothetical protein